MKKTEKESGPLLVQTKRKKRIRKSTIEEFLCVVPALFLIIVTSYYPLAYLVNISFTDWNILKKTYNYVGLTNWKWFITNASGNSFFTDMGITLKYTIGSLIISIVFGMLLACLMNRMNKGFDMMRGLIFLPRYVAMSTAGILFIWILNRDYGIVNNIIEWFGGQRIGWLTSGNMAMISLWLLTGWHSVGYSMMIYISAMTSIPKEYYESASLDGANRWQRFKTITIPLLSPTTLFLFVTHFIGSMKVYNAVDTLTNGGPYRKTEVIVYLIYRLVFEDYRVDRASVVALVFFLFLLVVTIITMRWSDNKVHYDM